MTAEQRRAKKARDEWYRAEARRYYGESPNVVEEHAEVHEVAAGGGAYVTCQVWVDGAEAA